MQEKNRISAADILAPLGAFALLLVIIFREFLFDPGLLMLNSDQLNGIGSRFIRIQDFFITQWDASKLGGMPTLDATFGDVYHPLVLLHFIMDPARAIGVKFILTVWIAFGATLVLARHLTGSWPLATVPAFLYALNPQFFTHIYGGHDGKMMVFAAAPLAVLGILRIARYGQWWGVLLVALSITWMIISSHLQLTYLFLWGLGFYTLFEIFRPANSLPRTARLGRLGMASLGLTIALAASAFQIIPPYIYTTQQSVRGSQDKTSYEHAVSWSLHHEELASMLVPGFLEADVGKARTYWGHNFFKLNHDAPGAALTFLAFLALFLRRYRGQSLFWLAGSALALSYAMGDNSPLFRLYYEIMPGVKNFRAPSMAIFWIPLGMVLMSIPVLRSLREPEGRRELLPGLLGFAGLVAIVVIARFTWIDFLGLPAVLTSLALGALLLAVYSIQDSKADLSFPALVAAFKSGLPGTPRLQQLVAFTPFVVLATFFWNAQTAATAQAYSNPDQAQALMRLMQSQASAIIPSAVLVIATAIAFWFVMGSQMAGWKLVIALILTASLDLWIINKPFVQNVPKRQYLQTENPVLRTIGQDAPDPLQRPRLLSASRNTALSGNIFPAYHMSNALGFHDNELDSYRRFRGGAGNDHLLQNPMDNPYLQLLNVGYLIYDGPQGTTAARLPGNRGWGYLVSHYQVLPYDSIPAQIGRKGYPFRSVAPVESPIPDLPAWDPSQTIVLSATAEDSLPPPSPFTPPPVDGEVQLVSQVKDDTQEFRVRTAQPALLVVAGNYHPYWKATIGEESVPVVRAYGTLRAVAVPAGEHIVRLQYRSDPLQLSLLISGAGFALMLLLAVITGLQLRRRTLTE